MAHTNRLADRKTNKGYNNWTEKNQDIGLTSTKKSKNVTVTNRPAVRKYLLTFTNYSIKAR